MKKIMEKLVNAPSVSGSEEKMALLLQELMEKYFDEVYTDNAKNLVFHKRGEGQKVMFCACLDTPGVIVTSVENSNISIAPLGDTDVFSSSLRAVRFENGAVGLLHCEKISQDTKISDFTVEIFDKSKMVNLGEKGYFEADFVALSDNIFAGFGLSQKICAATLVQAAKSISTTKKDVYFVFCTQTSLGFRSSAAAANTVKPDVVYVLATQKASFGKLLIRVLDKSFTSDSKLVNMAKTAMEETGVEYALSANKELVSQAPKLQAAEKGCEVCQLDLPVKYHGTCRECVSLDDAFNMSKVILQLLK